MDNKITIDPISALPERHRKVYDLRHKYGWTYKRIGDDIGVSQWRVRQILARAMRTIKAAKADAELHNEINNSECQDAELIPKCLLSVRTSRCLRNEGIFTVGQAKKFLSYGDRMLRVPNFGIKSMKEFTLFMEQNGWDK